MQVSELMRSRRTIHQYQSKPVEDELLRQALELALWAPNHRLTFPWRFSILGPESRQVLAKVSSELKAKKKPLSETEKMAIEQDFMKASHLVVAAINKSEDPEQAREDYAAMAAGLQNAALFLWSHGVGSKWSTGAITRQNRTYEIAGYDARQQEIVGFFWVGYAKQTPKETTRPRLDQCLQRRP